MQTVGSRWFLPVSVRYVLIGLLVIGVSIVTSSLRVRILSTSEIIKNIQFAEMSPEEERIQLEVQNRIFAYLYYSNVIVITRFRC